MIKTLKLFSLVFVFFMLMSVNVFAAQLGDVKITGQRDFVWPVPSCHQISSCYKNMDYSGHAANGGHKALDIPGVLGANVVAAYNGTVENSYWSNSFGNVVLIKHTNYQGKGITLYTQYNHMASRAVSKGTYVTAGTKIGTVGETGDAEGPHLDFIVMLGGYSAWRDSSIDPFANQILQMPSGFAAQDGSATNCCYQYVKEVKGLYATPSYTGPKVTADRRISEGIYYIRTATNTNYYLNINGSSTSSSANVNISTDAQKFRVTYLNNGYYKITSVKSGLALNVQGGVVQSGKNVIQFPYAGANNDQWIIQDCNDGYFYIASKGDKKCFLDVQGGYAYKGCNIEVFTGNGRACQKWRLDPVLSGSKTIANGTYKIQSALGSKYYLDIQGGKTDSTNAIIFENSTQTFNIKYLNNGFYKITCNCSNKVLDASNSDGKLIGRRPGANVLQFRDNNTNNQQWLIKSTGNGYCYFVNRFNGNYLDVQGGKAYNRCNVDTWPGNGNPCQKWKLIKVSAPEKTSITSLSSPKTKNINTKWKKVSGVNGYQIQFSRNSKFSSISKSVSTKSVSYNWAGATKRQKYYVRVRPYKTIGINKLYGSWSKVNYITAK